MVILEDFKVAQRLGCTKFILVDSQKLVTRNKSQPVAELSEFWIFILKLPRDIKPSVFLLGLFYNESF